jgi:hypothetical protein
MTSKDLATREYATSNATRLLCAGTYLDAKYRESVIDELFTNQHRVVAPSYGYDAVSVLGHALAAHRLRRKQVGATFLGAITVVALYFTGKVGLIGGVLLLLWVGWAVGYLRRIATFAILLTRLRPEPSNVFAGRYPASSHLPDALVRKIDVEQATGSGLIYYGGYQPFVGAGFLLDKWANAELLIEAPPNPLDASLDRDVLDPQDEFSRPDGDDFDSDDHEGKSLIPFTVEEITAYVADRMIGELRDEAPSAERIEQLTVERCKYAKAVAKQPARSDAAFVGSAALHWEENYDSAREYLCIRIGSWQQELVTSMFVGFDIKGNTLHTEFYPYVLPPIKSSFHLVDKLPDRIDKSLLVQVAWDVLWATPFDMISIFLHPFKGALPLPASLQRKKHDKALVRGDSSEFGLARYAMKVLDRGAVRSIRELATPAEYLHFFQESDTVKYKQIVERRLMQIIETFLRDHNVDLTDHHAIQNNILNQSYGDVNMHAEGQTLSQGNRGRQNFNGSRKKAETTSK